MIESTTWKEFPKNWKKALKKYLKLPFWRLNPNTEELQALFARTEIDLDHAEIENLDLIANFTELKYLNLCCNHIKSIDSLKNLRALDTLYLLENELVKISVLYYLGKLTNLDLSFNKVSDLSPLSEHSKLEDLDISYTEVVDLSTIVKCPLKVLDISGSKVIGLEHLSGLEKLAELKLCDSAIEDLSPLASCKELIDLNCSSSRVRSIEPLFELTKLEYLDVTETYVPIEQVDILKQKLPYCEVVFDS